MVTQFYDIVILVNGRLAQSVERHIDVVNVIGSNLLSPTRNKRSDFFMGDKYDTCVSYVRIRIGVEESTVLSNHKTRRGDRTSSIAHKKSALADL